MSLPAERLLKVAAPVVVGLLLLATWQLLVGVLGVAPSTVPSPAAIAQQLVANAGSIVEQSWITGGNALIGLLVGSLLAIALAGLAARFAPVSGMVAPIVAAIAVVPIVSLTPILNTMLGASSQSGRQLIAAIAAFVPVFVNVLRGLRQTRPVHRDLFLASAATGAQTFRKLTLPTALPHLMTGLRIASSVAVISALVAEYFGGPADGIGTAIAATAKTGRAALAWGYVAAAIAIGLAFFLVTLLLERVVSRHRPPG